jgi:peptide/nickel transport system substrate-binding protein
MRHHHEGRAAGAIAPTRTGARKRHNWIGASLSVCLLATLAACGSDDNKASSTTAAPTTAAATTTAAAATSSSVASSSSTPDTSATTEAGADTTEAGTDTTEATATSDGTATSDSTATTEGGTPVQGGVLNVAEFGPIAGLDPAKISNASAALGGAELAAIYDTIVRYNPETGKYDPRTGEFAASDDLMTWTLTLKPGIKFTDGTDYDANAVKTHIDRMMSPTSVSGSKGLLGKFLDTMEIKDAQTLVFHLKLAWAGFPTIFTKEAGMVESPAAVAKAGDDFATKPGDAGAGPFMVKSYAPNEELVLVKNPNYYGTPANLDEIHFSVVGGGDPERMFQALQGDSVQLMTTRNPEVIAAGKDGGFTESVATLQAGSLLGFNAGNYVCSGGAPQPDCANQPDGTKVTLKTPTSDPRVRLAIAEAVDRDVLNQRAYNGKEEMSPDLFTPDFLWNPDVPGVAQNVDDAKKLVEAAKADGWDGHIRMVAIGTPQPQALSIALAAQLQAVGITVDLDNDNDVTQQVTAVSTEKSYDVAVDWGYELPQAPDEFYAQLNKAMNSVAPRFGYSSPEMDAALDQLRVATTDDARTAAFKTIAEVWNRDMPAAILGVHHSAWIGSPKLHGITQTTSDLILLGDAWLEP